MLMIAFAQFVVVTHNAFAIAAIEQAVFEAMLALGSSTR